jgi:hypothetical protein
MKHHYLLPTQSGSKRNFRFLLLVLLTGILQPVCLKSQQSYTFTNCGATGRFGPTQTQVTSAYVATNLSLVATTSPTSGIQTWTVPTTGLYRVTAWGASGGDATSGPAPGFGAIMAGDFMLSAGDVLRILVGQMGQDRLYSAGGGGGSFVTKTPYNTIPSILVIAGGGGASSADFAGLSAVTATCGTFDVQSGPSQCNGNGGISFTGNSGAGGGGFFTTGQNGGIGQGGMSYTLGGLGGSSNNQQIGGFGGGGGQDGTGTYAASGGGGFSGGNGGNRNSTSGTGRMGGGGGGSYNSGSNQLNSVNTATGHGRVVITELCSIAIFNSLTGTISPAICAGNSLTLTTNAVSGYSWSTGATTNSIVVSPTSNTSYSLVGTSSLACNASAFVNVTVNSGLPVLSVVASTNQVCLGQTATLTASGANTYTWTGGVLNGQTFTPTATNSYTVSGQNGCGTSNAVATITVAPLPVSVISTASVLCQGYPATLTAVSSGTVYNWMPNGVSGASVVVTPTANTIYTVTVSDGICGGTNTVSINSITTPTISASGSSSVICQGGQVVLSATGGSTYVWSPGNLSGTTVTVSPSSATLYNVVGTNSLGCSSQANAIVLVNPSPTIAIAVNSTLVCAGDTVALTASGGSTYNWVNGPATPGYTVNPTAPAIYTVIASHPTNTCTAEATIAISAIVPAVTLPSNTMVCIGSSVALVSGGATTYEWNSVPTGTNGVFVVQPTSTSVFTLVAFTQSLTANCPTTHTVQVTVNPLPTVSVSATPSIICKNEASTLTATGASNYTWTSLGNGSSVVVTPTATTIYTLVATDANGCSDVEVFQVKVNGCTGLEESSYHQSQLQLFPNPSRGLFTIQVEEASFIHISNALGANILHFELGMNESKEVDLGSLSSGIYFIHAQNNNGTVIKKLVLTR